MTPEERRLWEVLRWVNGWLAGRRDRDSAHYSACIDSIANNEGSGSAGLLLRNISLGVLEMISKMQRPPRALRQRLMDALEDVNDGGGDDDTTTI